MSRHRRIASDALKMAAAADVGIADKVRDSGWETATSGEIGQMVGSMVVRGKRMISGSTAAPPVRPDAPTPPNRAQVLLQNAVTPATTPAQQIGADVARRLNLEHAFNAADGWRSFAPRDIFRFAEGVLLHSYQDNTAAPSYPYPLMPATAAHEGTGSIRYYH